MKAQMLLLGALALGGCASMGHGPTRDDATYVRLFFVQSASECHARQAEAMHAAPSARTKPTAECFVRANGPGLEPQSMPAYVLQVVSTGAPRPAVAGTVSVTYRSLGPLHLAKDEAGTNPQPLGTGDVKVYRMLVFSSPTAGTDADFNQWYEQQHVPDVLRVPGFISGRRFVSLDPQQTTLGLPPYLVVFELKSADLKATGQEIGARIRDGRTRMSPTFDGKSARGIFVTPID
jgi:hypothetical protein